MAEVEAVNRGIAFSRATGSPVYFVHLSTAESVRLVVQAREKGLPILGEVCAHHVSLDDSVYAGDDARRFVMTPPLRSASTTAALLDQVRGGAVDAMGSDHCGYSLDQRGSDSDFTAASPGIPGVETLLTILYTTLVRGSGMPVETAIELVTSRPADIFGLSPRKGRIAVGADADLVLFDPSVTGALDEDQTAFPRRLLALARPSGPRIRGAHRISGCDRLRRWQPLN